MEVSSEQGATVSSGGTQTAEVGGVVPVIDYIECKNSKGVHRMAFKTWKSGEWKKELPPVLCVHALSRNSTDFDYLATRLMAMGYLVVTVDVVGRGLSDKLEDPSDYKIPQYCNDIVALLNRLGWKEFHYVGTSMGGLIGMTLLAAKMISDKRVLGFILNDIGPFVKAEAVGTIGEYVSQPVYTSSLAGMEEVLRERYKGFGPVEEPQWTKMARDSVWVFDPSTKATRPPTREESDGKLEEPLQYTLNYDVGIAANFTATNDNIDIWEHFKQVQCKGLMVFRGKNSNILDEDTAEAMIMPEYKGEPLLPNVMVKKLEIEETAGHAPSLWCKEHVGAIVDFFQEVEAIPGSTE